MSRKHILSIVIIVLALALTTQIAQAVVTVSGTLSTSSAVQAGRIFRDGVASTCDGKAFPGNFGGGAQYYQAFGPYGPVGTDTCMIVDFNVGTCNFNAHAVAYLDSYNPGDFSQGYLGDVGSSVSQQFSFMVPAGHSFVVVVHSNSGATGLPCGFSFVSADANTFAGVAGPDLVAIPSTAVVGKFLVDTPAYADPNAGAATNTVITAGKTLWVFGVDPSGEFYRVMIAGKFFWVPVGTMGPNPDAVWNSKPLPTVVIETSGVPRD